MKTLTVCALLYGDYPKLAERCLSSIASIERVGGIEVKIGANAVSSATKNIIGSYNYTDRTIFSDENICKYPMMRRLIESGVSSDYFMWFDDDSFLREPTRTGGVGKWLDNVFAAVDFCDMIGDLWYMRLNSGQRAWIRAQSWYAGGDVPEKVRFATGGWWTIKTSILKKYDWPSPSIKHRGGDVMLGALFYQQALTMDRFTAGVAINANEKGENSKSERRGFDEAPVGTNFKLEAATCQT